MGRDGTQEWFLTSKFADLAGVTVRTLRYYDRVGLLKVDRTSAGYRRYHLRDLERVEQIVALKFLGLSLLEIRGVIDGAPLSLVEALVRQRDGLFEKRQLLDRAIGAIEEARAAISAGRSTTELLRKIIEVMEMQNDSSWMMKYYSPDAQAKLAERAKMFTAEDQAKISQDWKDYYRDLATVTEQGDPDGTKALELAVRHRELLGRFTGNDPDIEAGLTSVYRDRATGLKRMMIECGSTSRAPHRRTSGCVRGLLAGASPRGHERQIPLKKPRHLSLKITIAQDWLSCTNPGLSNLW